MAAIATLTVDNASPMATNWTASFGSGLNGNGTTITPPNYTANHGSDYDGTNAPSTANQRLKVTLNFTTLGAFSLYGRKSGTTYVEVKFTPGASTSPAFVEPDTFQIFEVTSGVPIAITPSHTANAVPHLYPAWDASAKTFSLRADRITTGDTFELQFADGQVLVKRNDIVIAHELCSITQNGTMGLINYDSSGAADNTYTVPKGGDLGVLYCSTSGNDTTGTGTFANPWRTIGKLVTTQVAGEIGFVRGGSYTEQLGWYSSKAGKPRVGTTLEEPIFHAAYAGETVENASTFPWHASNGSNGDIRYMYSYKVSYRLTSGVNDCVAVSNYTTTAGYGNVWHGCGIYADTGTGNGISIGHNAPSADEGDNWIRDCHFKGCGQQATSLTHNMYLLAPTRVEYNLVDGAVYSTGVATKGMGIQLHYGSDSDVDHTSGSRINYNEFKNHTEGSTLGGVLFGSGTDIEVIGNYIHDNKYGIYAWHYTVNARLENNLVVDNVLDGIRIGTSGSSTHTGIRLYNNTVVGSGGVGINLYSAATSALVKNNLSYNNTGGNLTDNGTGTTASNNETDGTNPVFVPDTYELDATSPFVTTPSGADLSGLMTYEIDRWGYTRPQNSGWTVGASVFPDPSDPPVNTLPATFSISGWTNLSGISVSSDAGNIKVGLSFTGTVEVNLTEGGTIVKGTLG